jgi:FdhD protein
MPDGSVRLPFRHYRGEWTESEKEVAEEGVITLYVNGAEWAALMATPLEQDKLALGFLHNEGVIETLGDVRVVTVNVPGTCVDVWLDRPTEAMPPQRRILTSGCGGGLTFADLSQTLPPLPLELPLTVSPKRLAQLMHDLEPREGLHAQAGGTHTAGLADEAKLLEVCEDIGRHNAIDKVCGGCLQRGVDTRGRLLLCTGRISSDMLRKAARMGCPIVVSRTTPTSLAVQLAQTWNITLVGYVRGNALSVYTHPGRIVSGEKA